jgi:hypothetical protein
MCVIRNRERKEGRKREIKKSNFNSLQIKNAQPVGRPHSKQRGSVMEAWELISVNKGL